MVITKDMIAIVRAIPLTDYFKEVMPHVDDNLADIWADLLDNNKSLCPFHQERTPSFRYHENTNTCYCHGCGTGGDTIAIHRKLFSVGFDDAVEFLYTHFIGDDVDSNKLKRMAIEEQESKAELMIFNHSVLDRVTPKNYELAEDLSLLIRLGKLTGESAVDYYKQKSRRV